MGNVIDYLIQYGDQAFAERAFCDVDVLILAQLSYFDFGSAVPTIAQHKKSVTLEEIDRTADLSAVFADKWYGENNRKLWNALLAGRRFRTMRCNYYRERMEEEQEAQAFIEALQTECQRVEQESDADVTIVVCPYIMRCKREQYPEKNQIVLDSYKNVILDESDWEAVSQYDYAKSLFIYMNQGAFLEATKALRK